MDYTKGLSKEDIKKYQRGDTFGKKDRERYDRAQDFKNQKVKDVKNFNYDQHNRKGVEGTHVSGQEAKFVQQQGGRQAAYDSLKAQKDAGATFGKRAQAKFDRMGERLEAKSNRQAAKEKAQAAQAAQPVQPAQKHVETPTDKAPSNPQTPVSSNNNQTATNTGDIDQKTNINNTQKQEVKQDNDISTNVNGNNNVVNNNQDNSIRNYGGDNRSLVINTANTGNQSGGSGSGLTETLDGVATAGTLGGLYDVDDSPAGQAKRLDQNITMARDNAKKYANVNYADETIANATRNLYIDPQKLDERIKARENYSRSKATVMAGDIFGDMFNFDTPTWKSPKPAKPVESPDFDKMYDNYTDF